MRAAIFACAIFSAACFNIDEQPCSFACGPGNACPDDYMCLSDGYCHLHGMPGACGYSDAAMAPDANMDQSMSMDLTSTDLTSVDGGADLATADLAMPDLAPFMDLLPAPDGASPTLSVTVLGIGTVTSTPSGINCDVTASGTCTATFPDNQSITLSTTGSFKSWGPGPCSAMGSTTPCTFNLNPSLSQTAAFYAAGNFPTTANATAADNAALDPSAITVEAYVVISSTNEASANVHVKAVSKGDPFAGGSVSGYQLGYKWDGTKFVAEFALAASSTLLGCDGTTAIAPGSAHYLAGEYSTTNGVALYVDGTQVCSGGAGSGALTAGTGALTFGAPSGDANPFAGTIDEVRISNTDLYSATYTPVRHPTAQASTVALYHLDTGTGVTLRDSSGNGLDATVGGTGFTWVAEP